jgi:hypothetical protein
MRHLIAQTNRRMPATRQMLTANVKLSSANRGGRFDSCNFGTLRNGRFSRWLFGRHN